MSLVPIMMYHIIAPLDPRTLVPLQYVDPELLDQQMALLKKFGFQAVQMSALAKGPVPKKSVVLTFDDAYVNFHEAALPILEKYGFTATVFVVGNQIGGTNAWDVALGDVAQPLMNLEQIQDCVARGIEIGGHTMDHLNLSEQSEASVWSQVSENKNQLEDLLGIPIESFCYPYGGYNQMVRDQTERAGYKVACRTMRGYNGGSSDLLALRRLNCKRDTTIPKFFGRLLPCLITG